MIPDQHIFYQVLKKHYPKQPDIAERYRALVEAEGYATKRPAKAIYGAWRSHRARRAAKAAGGVGCI